MSWATRGGRRYYYQAVKVNGRAQNIYLGSGPEAERAAAEVEQRRREHAEVRANLQKEQQRPREAVAWLDQLAEATQLVFQAAMLTQGYYLHARSQWRRRAQRSSC